MHVINVTTNNGLLQRGGGILGQTSKYRVRVGGVSRVRFSVRLRVSTVRVMVRVSRSGTQVARQPLGGGDHRYSPCPPPTANIGVK